MENVAGMQRSQGMLEQLSNENGQLQMQLRQMQQQASQPQHLTGLGGKDMMIRQLQQENRRLQQSIIGQGITVTAKPEFGRQQQDSGMIQQLQFQLDRMKGDKDRMI